MFKAIKDEKVIAVNDSGDFPCLVYDSIEEEYIKPGYPNFNYLRYLSIFGGVKEELPDRKIMLYLNQAVLVIINKDLPKSILKRMRKIRKG